jgi:APA family basic amino acid/polyamine antiporter
MPPTAPVPSRALGQTAATALVVGQVIAVGIFLTPGTIIRTVASPVWVVAVWAVMGTMAICGALCYGALAARYPQAGGGYVYLREAYGPRVAFLYGWKCLLVMDPGITAALAIGFASYVSYLWPVGATAARLVAITAIVAFAGVHIAGVRVGARLITTVSALKIGLVLALIMAALFSSAGGWQHFVPMIERRDGSPPWPGALAGAFVAAFFSFGGWWEVPRMTGEVRDPSTTMPRALWRGLALVTAIYIATTLAFILVVPIERVAAGEAFVAQVGQELFGSVGGAVVAGVVIVCVLGSLGTMQMLAPRLYMAMADDGLFPKAAGALHPRLGTPVGAIVLQATLASLLVALGTFDAVIAYFIFITVVFVAAVVASVFVFRRRTPGWRVPGYPWTPAVFLVLVAVLLVLLVVESPVQALVGLVIVAAALPVYRLLRLPADEPGERTVVS